MAVAMCSAVNKVCISKEGVVCDIAIECGITLVSTQRPMVLTSQPNTAAIQLKNPVDDCVEFHR